MKYRIAYYLVLLYITVMLKPVLPIISDAYAHVFAETIHIATVHAKYGSNHLAYDLAHANCDDNAQNQTTPKPQDPFPYHYTLDQLVTFSIAINNSPFYGIFYLNALSPVEVCKFTPPPRLA